MYTHDGGSWQTSHPSVSVMMMLLMSVMMTIRTGRCAAHSATRLARVAATGLAQRHAPPEVARELAHFLWQWHRLIEIGQELAKHSSSSHIVFLPITFVPLNHAPLSNRLPRPDRLPWSVHLFTCESLTYQQPCTIIACGAAHEDG